MDIKCDKEARDYENDPEWSYSEKLDENGKVIKEENGHEVSEE